MSSPNHLIVLWKIYSAVQFWYMATAAIKLYKALVQAGIDDDAARQVSEEIITSEDAKTFATKADLAELKSTLIVWMVGLHLTTIGLVVALLTLLKS